MHAQSKGAAFRPTLNFTPRSPTTLPRPVGRRSMKTRAFAAAAASSNSSSVASGLPEEKVLANRAVEEKALLRHHANHFTQRVHAQNRGSVFHPRD